MKISPWQIGMMFSLMFLAIGEIFGLLYLLGPALKADNPRWVMIDVGALFVTVLAADWQFKRVLGPFMPPKEKPSWQRMKQFSSWYGILGYVWFLIQIVLDFQLSWQIVGSSGTAWRIGLAIEALITFGLLMWWINHKLASNPPKKMGSVLWPSYVNCLLILSLYLIPAGHPIGMSPFSIENGHMDQSGIQMICYSVIFAGGLIYYHWKERGTKVVGL